MSDIASLVFYITMFVVSATLLWYGGSSKIRTPFVVIGVFLLTAMGAIRLNVGTDYVAYTQGYDLIASLSTSGFFSEFGDSYEPGIYLFAVISSLFPQPLPVFFGLFSLFTVLFTYLGLRRYKVSSMWIALVLYLLVLFPSSFNIMRQMLAVAIFFYASSFVFDRKLLKYTLLIGLTALFHKSAIILLPLYFVNRLIKRDSPITMRPAIVFAAVSAVLVVAGPFALSLLTQLPLFDKYDKYQDGGVASTGAMLILKLIILGVIAMFYRHIKQYPYVTFFVAMSIVEVLIAFITRSSVDIGRFSVYFSIFPLILLSYIPFAFKGKSRKIAALAVVFCGGVLFYMTYYVAGGSEIFPYNYSLTGGRE